MSIELIALPQLFPHPDNPRFAPREDVVEQIAAQLNGHMDEAHALIVRPIEEGYQIVSGHHRRLAAIRAHLSQVPCWVREMTDDEAYMQLVLLNAQSELLPIELGLHALKVTTKGKHGQSVNAYAQKVSRPQRTVALEVNAAEVYEVSTPVLTSILPLEIPYRQLAEIHAAPPWLWPVLVQHLIADDWSIDNTKKHVASVRKIETPPAWVNLEAVTIALMDGSMKSADLNKFASIVAQARREIIERKVGAEDYLTFLDNYLESEKPGTLSQVQVICNTALTTQATQINGERALAIKAQQEAEASAARVSRLRQHVSLKEWETLSHEEQNELLNLDVKGTTFNKQSNKAIEWADWSWNPITGCLHECSYCYARDITMDERTKNAFPNGFDPTLKPTALLAPRVKSPPKEAVFETRLKNVFTGSMSDIWGRWIPQSWIEAILREVTAAPEWNFLFLTKFPNRMAEFKYPENAWLGTTVDLQARVDNAEKAFAKVEAKVKWLSIEPMLEPLKFTRLDLFDWIVIGGASKQSQTPEWKPPFIWIYDIMKQAESAGVDVYVKDNLLGCKGRDGLLNLPHNMTIKPEVTVLPDVFHYLKGAS